MNPFTALNQAIALTHQTTLQRHQRELELNTLMAVAADLVRELFSKIDLSDVNTPTSATYLNILTLLPREVSITLSMLDLDSLKDQKLMDALEVFMDWGDPTVTTATWNDIPDRTFCFSKRFEEQDLLVTVRIRGVVIRNSPTCRKVRVGTDVTEVPKYEIVCE